MPKRQALTACKAFLLSVESYLVSLVGASGLKRIALALGTLATLALAGEGIATGVAGVFAAEGVRFPATGV